MPQKKNPDIAELVRGKTGRVYGDLVSLFTVMKALPLAYNKDMQEDKEPLFDAIDTLKACLPVFGGMLATLKVRADRMYEATAKGYLNATDAADYLAKRGVPFREAHAVVGKAVRAAIERGIGLEEFTAADWRGFSAEFGEDILEVVTIGRCVAARDMFGGTAPGRVDLALGEARVRLGGLLSR
jgi:argininosuccinate lyase